MNTTSSKLLARLVGFPSITDTPNLAIADWIEDMLTGIGATVDRLPSADGSRAGLLARIGPKVDGGILLSAHMDVVPVVGQDWSHDPFILRTDEGRHFGRGACDMKGFLACALIAARTAATVGPLKRPLLLSLSYDEEIGCRGMTQMIDHVIPTLGRPSVCIVGEPTEMRIAVGHKGKVALRAVCHGTPGHSANAPAYVNAVQIAARLVVMLDDMQRDLRDTGPSDPDYDIGYCTVHVGRIAGGVALNMVPQTATVDFEVRYPAGAHINAILTDIRTKAAAICDGFDNPAARVEITEITHYPALETPRTSPAVSLVERCLPRSGATKVAFGTEAGFFDRIGIPTVVCGPGSMAQGHQPDEYIAQSELDRCDAFLARLVEECRDRRD